MPQLIINIVNGGTPEINTDTLQPTSPSIAGHVWYTLRGDDGSVDNFGFAPATPGSPFGIGKVFINDQNRYAIDLSPEGGDYQFAVNISQDTYSKMLDFGNNPKSYGFDVDHYKIGANDCISFLWKGLGAGDLPTQGYKGDILPVWNVDNIERLLSGDSSQAFTQVTPENLGLSPSEFTLQLSDTFQVAPADLINNAKDYFANVFGLDNDNFTAYNGNLEDIFGNLNLTLPQSRYYDSDGNIISKENAVTAISDGEGNNTISLVKDGVSVSLADGTKSSISDVVEMVQSSASHLSQFIYTKVSEFTSSYQDYLVGHKEEIIGNLISRVLLGESLEDAVIHTAEIWGVNALLNNNISNQAFNDLISGFTQDPQILSATQAGVVSFISTILISGIRGGGLNGEDYTEASVRAVAIGAIKYFIPAVPVDAIMAIIDAGITSIEHSDDFNSEDWESLGVSTGAAVASATIGWIVGAQIGAAIGSTIFPGFGTIVGSVVGALITAIIYQPLSNLYRSELDATKEIYDAIEDTIIKLDFSKNNLEENVHQIIHAVGDIARAFAINLPEDLAINIYNLLGGHYGKTYKPGEYPNPYSFIQVIPKPDGTGNQIIGVEREGAVLIASENGDDDIYGTNGQDIMIGKSGKNTILGYGGNDHIEGRSNDDILIGGTGDDEIYGGLGNDYLSGSEGNDNLFGNQGDDAILGGDGNDYIEGGAGNDQIEGEAGSDYISGGDGDDIILGGAGNDIIEGGNGNDTILGEDGDDIILAGAGNDIVDGGAGNDVIEGGAGNDNLKGGDGDDTIYGNDGVDIIYGDAGSDIINAGADDDLVFGGIGNDILFGSDGNDSLYGEIGNDYLIGGDGDDILDGFTGDDVLMGGKGDDTITGGEGNDTIIFLQGDGQDTIIDTDTAGSDVIRLADTNSDKIILSQDNQDLVIQFLDANGEITSDKITIKNEFNLDGTASSIIDRIEFADGKKIELTDSNLVIHEDNTISFVLENYSNIDTSIQTELALGYQDNFAVDEGQTINPYSTFYENNYETSANQDQIDNEKFNEVQWHSHKEKRSIFGGYYNVWTKYYENNLSGTNGNDRIVGNWWGESISGGNGDDQLSGNDGNDTIHGGAGNDLLSGGAGNDAIYGEAGNDQIYGGTGNDIIDGGDGNDNLIGNEGDDNIFAGSGDDRLEGDGGNDNLNLGTGNNIAYGNAGSDTIISGDGKNFIDGGGDSDVINVGNGDNNISATSGNDTINAGNGNNTIFGGDGNDNIVVGSGDNYIAGGSGDDIINTGNGNNQIYGNLGNDQITSGSGVDYIYGGAGVDTIKSGAGNDVVYGNSDQDWLEGEEGNDQIYGGTGSDNIFGGDGNDIIYGEADGDVIYGGAGNDQLFGGAGNDILIDDAGSDILDGGADQDILILTKEDSASTSIDTINNFNPDEDKIILKVNYKTPINLAIIQASMQQNGDNLEINLDNGQTVIITNTNKADITESNFAIGLSGGDDNQILFGTDGNDTLFGDAGNNTLYGGNGNDELWGGLGNDALYGQSGNDILRYEADGNYSAGNSTKNFYNGQTIDIAGYNVSYDIFNGGNGQDVILMTEGNDVLDLEKPTTDPTQPKVRDVSTIYAGAGDDIINFSTTKFSYGDLTIYGGDGNDKLWSNAGNDYILGGAGNDEIYSGSGNDNIDGGVGDDTIYSGDGNDTIVGGEGNDWIDAGDGNDLIIAGSGADYINGGNGSDTISYINSSSAIDVEFNHYFTLVGSNGIGTSYFSNIVNGGDAQGDELLNVENVIGSAYDDTIFGSLVDFTNNQITGGAGNDNLAGGLGNDTYIYNLGDGNDTITESDFNYIGNQQGIGVDTIQFGVGITESDLSFTNQGNDLIIQIGGDANNKITIKNQNLPGLNNKVEYLTFDNGNNINLLNNLYLSLEDQSFVISKQTLDYSIIGTNNADNLFGNVADNRIYGNLGNDILRGDDGNDTIYGGDGSDTIYGNGVDVGMSLISKDRFNWQYYLRVNEDLASNPSLNNIDAAWNNFWNYGRFEGRSFDPNINTYYSSDSNKLYGGDGSDIIFGGYGDDIISGGVGDDNLQGNSGDDQIYGGVGNDRLQGGIGDDFLSGEDGSNNLFGGDGNDYILGGSGNDTIYGGNDNDLISGDAGDDIIYGEGGDDILQGGAGNDILYGGNGSDIYLYSPGYGADIIRNANSTDAVDKIKFSSSIIRSDLIFVKSGNDLLILFKDNDSDQIKIENHFAQTALNKVDYLEFADGSIVDLINGFNDYAEISSIVNGSGGNDNFLAASYQNNEFFVAGSGNDHIEGGKGNDVIKGGDGDDAIYGNSAINYIFNGTVKASSDYGSSFASMSFNSNPRELADVNGDGRADVVAFASDGVYVSLANNDGTFAAKFKAMDNYYISSLNWQSFNTHPLMLADINGDHRADIIGFIKVSVSGGVGDRVYSSLTSNGAFNTATLSYSGSFSPFDNVPRQFIDINGDGKKDMVYFGYTNSAYAVLGNGSGGFSSFGGNSYILTNDFGNGAYSSYDRNPRALADVNDDGKADIIVFADDGVYVSLAGANNSFYGSKNIPTYSAKAKVISDFGYNQGWTSDNIYIRKVVDINGDDRPDIVGFGSDGVYASLNNGNGTFATKIKISDDFGVDTGWVSNDQNPRDIIDVNGDGKADIVGFKNDGVYASLAYLGTTSENNLIYGNAGNDTLYGSAGNDTLNGGSGSDIIDGRNGNDTIIIDQESGSSSSIDTINNFNSTQDEIIINVSDQSTFSNIQSSMVQVGNNVRITLSNNQQVIITNTSKSIINSSNLIINNVSNNQTSSNDSLFPNISSQGDQIESIQTQPSRTEVSASHGVAVIGADGNINYTPNQNFSGVDNIIYRELDANGVVLYTKSYSVFVSDQNDAPTTSVIANQEINPEQQFTIKLSDYFSDVDVDNLQYTVKLNGNETLPDGIVFDQATKTISGILPAIQNLHFDITASDGKGGFANNQFDINVVAPTASGANIVSDLLVSFANPNPENHYQPVLSEELINQISQTVYVETQGSSFSENITANNNSDNNFIDAQSGNDHITTFAGNDVINAGSGDDIINSGTGNDIITGGTGSDTFIITSENTGGETTITDFEYSNPNEKIDLSAFTNIHSMNDITITEGSAIVHLHNEDGSEQTIHILNATLTDITTDNFIFAATPDLNLVGTSYNDTLTGGEGNDTLNGGSGSDLLSGGAGNDTLIYSSDKSWSTSFVAWNIGSPDAIDYSGEQIRIAPRVGNADAFDGGDGIDTIQMSDTNEALFLDDRYTNNPFGYNTARIKNIEVINTGGGDDIIDLTSDQFSYSNITLNGEDGNDVLWSSSGNDTINGGSGNDILNGGEGNDTIYGKNGDDQITGNQGLDILTGGNGNDTFSFTNFQDSTINQTDIITDFTQGQDKINLSGLNYGHITFDDNLNDTTIPEGLSYHFDNDNNTIIQDQSHDFAIKLAGHINLNGDDFGF